MSLFSGGGWEKENEPEKSSKGILEVYFCATWISTHYPSDTKMKKKLENQLYAFFFLLDLLYADFLRTLNIKSNLTLTTLNFDQLR